MAQSLSAIAERLEPTRRAVVQPLFSVCGHRLRISARSRNSRRD